jgi:hypothetical protein
MRWTQAVSEFDAEARFCRDLPKVNVALAFVMGLAD